MSSIPVPMAAAAPAAAVMPPIAPAAISVPVAIAVLVAAAINAGKKRIDAATNKPTTAATAIPAKTFPTNAPTSKLDSSGASL